VKQNKGHIWYSRRKPIEHVGEERSSTHFTFDTSISYPFISGRPRSNKHDPRDKIGQHSTRSNQVGGSPIVLQFTWELRSSTPRLMSISLLDFCFTSRCKASWICRSFNVMSLASSTLGRKRTQFGHVDRSIDLRMTCKHNASRASEGLTLLARLSRTKPKTKVARSLPDRCFRREGAPHHKNQSPHDQAQQRWRVLMNAKTFFNPVGVLYNFPNHAMHVCVTVRLSDRSTDRPIDSMKKSLRLWSFLLTSLRQPTSGRC